MVKKAECVSDIFQRDFWQLVYLCVIKRSDVCTVSVMHCTVFHSK